MQSLEPSDIEAIAYRVGLRPAQVQRTLELLAEENAVPFIARYRRDDTDGLTEGDIREIRELANQLAELAVRKARYLRLIEARNKLTPELREQILRAETLDELEDLAYPFRANRKGLAAEALKKGLGPLAEAIWEDRDEATDLSAAFAQHVDGEKGLPDAEAVEKGVNALLVQRVAETYQVRRAVREFFEENAVVATRLARRPSPALQRMYGSFADYRCPFRQLAPGRAFHIVRGERRKVLAVSFEVEEEPLVQRAWEALSIPETHRHLERLRELTREAALNVILPQVQQSAIRTLRERANKFQLKLAERHIRRLLMQPPLRGERVLAIDPGYRKGCKCVALDSDGKPLDFMIIYPHEPLNQVEEAKQKLVEFVQRHRLTVAAIGNGTGCRETEELLSQLIAESLPELRFTVVNEVGADTYAKSSAGREEFPEQPPEFRAAVSIGRRLLDPLSEFVKIDPVELCSELVEEKNGEKSGKAEKSPFAKHLEELVASCVNEVGADANRANVHVLKYIAGLTLPIARSMVNWREQHEGFQARRQFLLVDRNLDERRFIQCAGFLKIYGGENPIEATWVHPEHYDVAYKLLDKAGALLDDVIAGRAAAKLDDLLSREGFDRLADELGVGRHTLRYIVDALKRPFHDPRQEYRPAVFRQKMLSLSDLEPGMELDGIVQNIVDFGAFVDVGASVTGLVHISRMSLDYISDPHECVVVGEPVRVWVHEVDVERQRLALSMIPPGAERRPVQQPRSQARTERRRPARRPRRPRATPAGTERQREGAAPVAASTGSNGAPDAAALVAQAPATQAPAAQPQPQRPAERTPAREARPQRAEKRRAKKSQPVELPAEAVAGKVPLRSFAELKALWEQLAGGEKEGEA